MLLVDDSPDDRELALRAFRKAGLEGRVVAVGDGEAALEHLRGEGCGAARGDARTGVVLLDLNMPSMDGHGVLARLRADERTRCVPVVVLTSSREEGDVRRAYELGANGYVRKPVDFGEFQRALGAVAGYWLGVNETAQPPAPAAPSNTRGPGA